MSDPTLVDQPPGRTKRALRVALISSLAVNLFLGAAIAAHFVTDHKEGPRFGGPAFKVMVDDLNEEEQEAYRDVRRMMRDNFKAARPIIHELRAARQEAAAAIAADPYDQAAVDAAFEKMRVLTDRLTVNMQQGMAEAMAAAPLEVRKKFAERLKRGPHGHMHGKKKDGSESGPKKGQDQENMDEAPPPDMMP